MDDALDQSAREEKTKRDGERTRAAPSEAPKAV